nr:ATP synthase F0 subunit 8 [Ensis leei]
MAQFSPLWVLPMVLMNFFFIFLVLTTVWWLGKGRYSF